MNLLKKGILCGLFGVLAQGLFAQVSISVQMQKLMQGLDQNYHAREEFLLGGHSNQRTQQAASAVRKAFSTPAACMEGLQINTLQARLLLAGEEGISPYMLVLLTPGNELRKKMEPIFKYPGKRNFISWSELVYAEACTALAAPGNVKNQGEVNFAKSYRARAEELAGKDDALFSKTLASARQTWAEMK